MAVFAFYAAALALSSQDVPRMTKEELKPLLGDPNVVVLDVRTPASYDESNAKIKGAVRVNMKVPIEAWMDQYPKDVTLVFY